LLHEKSKKAAISATSVSTNSQSKSW